MVEVISLLSSPLRSPGPPTRRTKGKAVARTEELFTFHSDDFESTGDLSFALSNSSKRRKLNDTSASRARPNSRIASLQPDFDNCLPDTVAVVTTHFKAAKATDFELSDSITFSSSAPQPRTTKKTSNTMIYDLSDDLPQDIFGEFTLSASHPFPASTCDQALRDRTANLLAELSRDTSGGKASTSKVPSRKSNQFRMVRATSAGASVVDDIFSSSPPRPTAKKTSKSKPAEAEKAARAEEKAQVKAGEKAFRNAEKEAEKERKRLEKERKAREKQKADDIAEVNKKKTDKKVTVQEMMLDMSSGLRGISAGNQIEEYMKELEVEIKYFDQEIDLSSMDDDSTFTYPGNIVKWRRKVGAEYNDEEGQWERIARLRIEQANHVLVHLTAVEFATIAAQSPSSHLPTPINEAAMKANLDKHITHLHSLVKDSKPIYLIEGLDSWLRKNATAKNRAYTAAVRAQEDPSSQAQPSNQPVRPRKRKTAPSLSLDLSHFDSELVERLQLHLQLHALRPLVHLTTSPANTATWIKTVTEHISTIPYRQLKLSTNLTSASFCMDSGQVKTGDTPLDTYVRMLQEVQRVTPSMAYGIAAQYGSVAALVRGFKKEGGRMLEDVRKSANKDGALSERRLGPMVSRRLGKVFLGLDEDSVDGIS